MFTQNHPGHLFIERYPQGLPTCYETLERCIDAYCVFLRASNGSSVEVPVPVERILSVFGIQVHTDNGTLARIGVEGLAAIDSGFVLVQGDDPQTRKRFTMAHELMEFFVDAVGRNRFSPGLKKYFRDRKKEQLCNWGAGRLLFPIDVFGQDLKSVEMSLSGASLLATKYQTSLLSTLIAMVERCDPEIYALFVLKMMHKPSELKMIAGDNQASLFEADYRTTPRKLLRIAWFALPPTLRKFGYPLRFQSIPDGSFLYNVYELGLSESHEEYLNLGSIQGECGIDAKAVSIDGEKCVVALIKLPNAFS